LSAHPYLRCLCISILLLECCSSSRVRAQTTIEGPATFDFDRDREPIISLNGVWRFHPGDDPDGKLGWAKPDFDDSSWPLLRSNMGWGEQGYKGYSGFAWYRFKVLLPNEQRRWAISLPQLLTSSRSSRMTGWSVNSAGCHRTPSTWPDLIRSLHFPPTFPRRAMPLHSQSACGTRHGSLRV
jgi:hypothetical protein